MQRHLEKEAAGELTARFARWLSTPIKGTPKLIQKVRTGPELDALEQSWRNGAERFVENPIRNALTKVRADKAFSGMAQAASVLKRNLPPEERAEWAQQAGKRAVDFIARKPHLALAHAPHPFVGAGAAAEVLETLKNRFLNATPGLKVQPPPMPMPKPLPQGVLPAAAGPVALTKIAAFADELEKIAECCGDDSVEAAYWKFDALHKGHEAGRKRAGLGPMDERMAFKQAIAPLLEKTAEVMPYQQSTQWSCSAACLKAVLGHYGVDVPEELAVQVIGARPNRGAECNEIMQAAHKLGFDAFEFSFQSLEQARWLLDQDMPIIADIQSFNHPGKGHYVVITGIDDQGVHLMDPNTPGNQRTISLEEMEERWWDRAMAPPHEEMVKWGIVILPSEEP